MRYQSANSHEFGIFFSSRSARKTLGRLLNVQNSHLISSLRRVILLVDHCKCNLLSKGPRKNGIVMAFHNTNMHMPTNIYFYGFGLRLDLRKLLTCILSFLCRIHYTYFVLFPPYISQP